MELKAAGARAFSLLRFFLPFVKNITCYFQPGTDDSNSFTQDLFHLFSFRSDINIISNTTTTAVREYCEYWYHDHDHRLICCCSGEFWGHMLLAAGGFINYLIMNYFLFSWFVGWFQSVSDTVYFSAFVLGTEFKFSLDVSAQKHFLLKWRNKTEINKISSDPHWVCRRVGGWMKHLSVSNMFVTAATPTNTAATAVTAVLVLHLLPPNRLQTHWSFLTAVSHEPWCIRML